MGVMKRVRGWIDSGWPVPRQLQEIAGLVEPRDPEAWKERKRAEKETAIERAAIRAEGCATAAPAVAITRASLPRPEIAAPDLEAEPPAWGDALPVRAQPGWYRLGRSFYRVGEGPFSGWGFPEPKRPPATIQRTLF